MAAKHQRNQAGLYHRRSQHCVVCRNRKRECPQVYEVTEGRNTKSRLFPAALQVGDVSQNVSVLCFLLFRGHSSLSSGGSRVLCRPAFLVVLVRLRPTLPCTSTQFTHTGIVYRIPSCDAYMPCVRSYYMHCTIPGILEDMSSLPSCDTYIDYMPCVRSY